jgi:hypothetical protein
MAAMPIRKVSGRSLKGMKSIPVSILAALVLLACVSPAWGETPGSGVLRTAYRDHILRSAARNMERSTAAIRSAPGRQAAAAALLAQETDRASRIPPPLAFLMSAAVPGAGQLAEGRNRAFAYLGLEAMAWIAHFSWKDAGDRKEVEYKSYADNHWSLQQWDSLATATSTECVKPIPDGVNYADARVTLISFIDARNYQHYYEDIGKLEAYRAGWDDFDCSSPTPGMSGHRAEYRSMRAKSNDYLTMARSAITVAFLNRIVSAVDAYRTARGARMRFAGAELKFGMSGSFARPKATIKLTKRF